MSDMRHVIQPDQVLGYDDRPFWAGVRESPESNPERGDLEIVHRIGDPNARYSFDDFILWCSTVNGKLYWASDSGCSCPMPFQRINRISDMETGDWHALKAAVEKYAEDLHSYAERGRTATQSAVTDLLRKAALAPAADNEVEPLHECHACGGRFPEDKGIDFDELPDGSAGPGFQCHTCSEVR